MAKIRGKGTSFLMTVAAAYTAIPNLISVNVSGEKAETYDSTTLDGAVVKTKDHTGYSEAATISAEAFYDPSNAVMAAWEALIATPANNNVKITYTDSGPTSVIYAGVGFGIDKTVVANDGVKATLTCETTGAPT